MTERRFGPAEQRWLAGLGAVRDVVRQTLVAEQVEAALAVLPEQEGWHVLLLGRVRGLSTDRATGTEAMTETEIPTGHSDARRDLFVLIAAAFGCLLLAPLGVPAAAYGAYRYWHLSRSTAVWLIVFAVVGTAIFASLFVQNLGFIGGDSWVGPATPAN